MSKHQGIERIFYVYVHRIADLNIPFYVGKGGGNRISSRRDRNKYWHHVVNKYGYTIDFVAKGLTESEAFAMEKDLIATFKSMNLPHFVNLTDGGEGTSGYVASEELRKKRSEAQKGKTLSEEHKRKISEAQKGNTHSEETKRKMSISKKGERCYMFGKPKSQEQKRRISETMTGRPSPMRRAVIGTNTRTSEECIFESITAAAALTNGSIGNIHKCCLGKRKTSKGWKFVFINKNNGGLR
jgi:group I intron endonuclease